MPLDNPNPLSDIYPLHSGFTGAVMYDTGDTFLIRAKDCNVSAKQEINAIDDVDGSIDKTRYTLAPFVIDGSFSFALDQSQTADSFAVFEQIFNDAVLRDGHGNMAAADRKLHVRYYSGVAFTYSHLVIDTLTLEVSQSSELTASATVKGRGRQPLTSGDQPNLDSSSDLAPVRAIMFNDVFITLSPTSVPGAHTIGAAVTSEVVRSFKMDIANNTELIYTLSSSLNPFDIIAKKRDITGSVTFAGRNSELADWAVSHEDSAQSAVDLEFAVRFSAEQPAIALFKLRGVVFQMEELSITNDLVETTMNFRAYGDQGFGYEAITGWQVDTNANADTTGFPFENNI
tara:strand:+ start:270 stop:1301 length:1032 start_codon:yes stop_codon:yes gene_type:complete